MARKKIEQSFSDIEEKENSDLDTNEAEEKKAMPKKNVKQKPEDMIPGKYRKFQN